MEIEHLLKKYQSLNSELCNQSRAIDVIKTNIMFKCEKLARKEDATLDGGSFLCKWCLNSWQPNKYSVSLQPEKKPKKRMRTLFNRDFVSLNKYQQKLVKKIRSLSSDNCLIFKCNICTKDTPVPLTKIRNNIAHQNENVLNLQNEEKIKKKKKKKKKKDKFAGLNISVLEKYRKPIENERDQHRKQVNVNKKKPQKIISYKQQIQIHRALMQAPVPKKKPSLLSSFLDSM